MYGIYVWEAYLSIEHITGDIGQYGDLGKCGKDEI
jgi:hypothetical protein